MFKFPCTASTSQKYAVLNVFLNPVFFFKNTAYEHMQLYEHKHLGINHTVHILGLAFCPIEASFRHITVVLLFSSG